MEEYRRRKQIVLDAASSIQGVDVHDPDGTYYLWADVRSLGISSLRLAHRLARAVRALRQT